MQSHLLLHSVGTLLPGEHQAEHMHRWPTCTGQAWGRYLFMKETCTALSASQLKQHSGYHATESMQCHSQEKGGLSCCC